jgi:hypothetical protein
MKVWGAGAFDHTLGKVVLEWRQGKEKAASGKN